MRILTLTNLYPPHHVGGYELRCRDITECLRQAGHSVRVLTSDHRSGAGEVAADPPHVKRALRIHGLFGHPWLGMRKLAALERHNNRTLRQAVAGFRPDVVHVWCMGGLSKSLCHTLRRLGVPAVFDVSDHWVLRSREADVWLDWWNRSKPSAPARVLRSACHGSGLRRLLDRTAPTAPVDEIDFRHAYFTSARLREITADAGFRVGHAGVIHCPVDTERFDGLPRTEDEPLRRWLWVGRIERDKGLHTALRALDATAPAERLPLCVYGRGEAGYVEEMRRWAQDRGLPVTWHSATPEQMPSVYRQHDALLFTSEWEEPFALTPLEAMACGTPVIGTPAGGSRELFRHGGNALVYPTGDAGGLAACMGRLKSDPKLRAALSHAGRDEVRTRFPLREISRQVERFLARAAA